MKRITSMLSIGLLATASAALAANTLTVINNPVMVSNTTSKVLSVNFSGGSNTNVYVQDDSPTDETHYKIKFWVNPHNLVNTANKSVRLGAIGDDANGQHVIIFLKRNDADSSWRINTWYKTDSLGYTAGPGVFIVGQGSPDQWRQVQIEWTRETTDGAANGSLKIQRIAPTTSGITGPSNLDTFNLQVDNIRIGSLSGQGVNAVSGSYLFDEFESYR